MRPLQTILITISFLALSLLIYLNWQTIDQNYLSDFKASLNTAFEKGDLNLSNVDPVLSGIDTNSGEVKVATSSELVLDETLDLHLSNYIQVENQDLKYFLLSFIIILVSEVGDKTFFIAALLAMKHSPMVVFLGSFSSLALMSVLSATLGHTVFNWLPKQCIGLLAAGLFLIFGFKMTWDGYKMTKEEENAELLETEEELNEKLLEPNGEDTESSLQVKELKRPWYLTILSPIFVQAFVLNFLAEWGDRSQISTITLAATGDIIYVSLGTVLGHSICTAGAVLGGKYLAEKISVKKLTILGGITFLIFAIIYFIEVIYFEF